MEDETCVVCAKERADIKLQCGHVIICEECALREHEKTERYEGNILSCPICKQRSWSYQEIETGEGNSAMNKIVK